MEGSFSAGRSKRSRRNVSINRCESAASFIKRARPVPRARRNYLILITGKTLEDYLKLDNDFVWRAKPPAQPQRGRTRGFNHSTNDDQSLAAATVVVIVVRVGIGVGVRVGITVTVGVSACSARILASIKSPLACILVSIGSRSALLVLLSTTLLALPSVTLADCGGRKQIDDGHEYVCRQCEEQKVIDLNFHGLDPP